MNYEVTRVIITKERRHDQVGKPLAAFNTLAELEELRLYISEMWNKEVKKVNPDDRIMIDFTVTDKTKKEEHG